MTTTPTGTPTAIANQISDAYYAVRGAQRHQTRSTAANAKAMTQAILAMQAIEGPVTSAMFSLVLRAKQAIIDAMLATTQPTQDNRIIMAFLCSAHAALNEADVLIVRALDA